MDILGGSIASGLAARGIVLLLAVSLGNVSQQDKNSGLYINGCGLSVKLKEGSYE